MWSKPGISVLLLIAAELIVFKILSTQFGFGRVLFVALLLSVLGFFMLVRKVPDYIRQSAKSVFNSDEKLSKNRIASRGYFVAAAVLLFVPGYVSAVFALLLLFPPVQAVVHPRISSAFGNVSLGKRFRMFTPGSSRCGNVVDVQETKNANRRSNPDLPELQ